MAGNKKPRRAYKGPRVLVAQTEMNRRLDGDFQDQKKYVKLYRYHTSKVLKSIYQGDALEIEELDKLNNFCKFALELMERSSMADIEKAWRNAEAISIIHHEMGIPFVEEPDYETVPDPKVRPHLGSESKVEIEVKIEEHHEAPDSA